MFEFLFKRPGDKPAGPQGAASEQSAAAGNSAGQGNQQAQARRAEQAAQAKALAGNEAAAVELILRSEFAEVRLAAAEYVQAQPLLEQVQQAMRNTDRRVAKLMQSRLDALRHQQAEQRQAEASIAQAQKLLQDEKLTPNQVADLDRQWQVIAAGSALSERFGVERQALAARLEAQVSLQRGVIDALAALRRLGAEAHPGDDAGRAAQAEQLARLQAEHATHLAHAERASLPRHLLSDFEQAMSQTQAALAQAQKAAPAAAAGHGTALADTPAGGDARPAADPEAPSAAPHAAGPAAEGTNGAAAHPQPGAAEAADVRPPREKHKATPADKEANRHFMELVDALEAALQQGQLHIAAEHDKALKESKTGRLSQSQAERLAHVRAELKRLGDWARWGGNVSREELVKAVEELPAQGLPMSELAKKVGSMRERWKALDGVSGAAPKSLWEKFDAACTAAYAPAAAHFKHLADERHTNAAKAQTLIDEVKALIARGVSRPLPADAAAGDAPGTLPHTYDWRAMASSSQRLRQAWSRLGTIDRKDKKKLDAAFAAAMAELMAPLEEQRKIEVARREQLVEEVGKLNPSDRNTIETLRRLQESWQEHAKALPLERKAEQALWQRFRGACDAIFAQRKEHAHAADAERRSHLHVREDICVSLENAAFEGEDKAQLNAMVKALRDAAAAWHASGSVPRAAEQKIEQRYKSAVAALQSRADAIRRRASAAQTTAMREKLRLTQALEAAIAAPGDIDADDWSARWQALPPLPGDFERTLRQRFEAGVKAGAGNGRGAYASALEASRERLLEEVLRLEIGAGIDSGAEFARERLKMQVEVLQSSLKSGHKPDGHATQFLQLCAMPALADDRTATRIEQLFRRLGAEAK
ncbi:DUF349 domain-containing protein [Pseudoduganella violacea]|uniref:DUF349 domain-containing protein n=1 Tax=Pseudoduganella violacea TaxID=1715466 RepID=A0A7W5BEI1_9BURK|nr:DUF349 domain-containing protein [Pseudoduganella violacea]MBB3121649.1 hypothetical protein [Pseudoduganella violacea]